MWMRIDDEDVPQAIEAFKSQHCEKLAANLLSQFQETKSVAQTLLVEAAREKYGTVGDGDEIEVDDDAALSEADEHAFVMMWGYVTFAEAGVDTDSSDTGESNGNAS